MVVDHPDMPVAFARIVNIVRWLCCPTERNDDHRRLAVGQLVRHDLTTLRIETDRELALATLALAMFLHMPFASSENIPMRDVWLLFHSDQEKHQSIIAVKDWITNIEW